MFSSHSFETYGHLPYPENTVCKITDISMLVVYILGIQHGLLKFRDSLPNNKLEPQFLLSGSNVSTSLSQPLDVDVK